MKQNFDVQEKGAGMQEGEVMGLGVLGRGLSFLDR
jgi:hypothetical protein